MKTSHFLRMPGRSAPMIAAVALLGFLAVKPEIASAQIPPTDLPGEVCNLLTGGDWRGARAI